MLYPQGKVLAGVVDEGVLNGTGAGTGSGRNLGPRGLLGKTPQELLRLMTYWELSTQKVGAHLSICAARTCLAVRLLKCYRTAEQAVMHGLLVLFVAQLDPASPQTTLSVQACRRMGRCSRCRKRSNT